VKSTEVYGILRQIFSSWCKEYDFRRTTGGMLGWQKPIADHYIVFWFQVSRDGWDEYAGSHFIVEFQISNKPIIGAGQHNMRWRLPKFLNEGELEQVRQMQNNVIGKLKKPDCNYRIFHFGDDIAKWYLAKFQLVDEKYLPTDDIWFRYKDKEDVERWGAFLRDILSKIIKSLTKDAS
jgi:hypothetical protein